MEKLKNNYVYHGSKELFRKVKPRRQIRSKKNKNGSYKIIFDDISFHATPYKWVAVAYMFDSSSYKIDGKIAHYGIGVDLYEHKKELEVLGFESLEKSLEKMYKNGGYLFAFDKDKFVHMQGLGNLEVVTQDEIEPVEVERIDNPVAELNKLGVKFKFIDLTKSENKEWRNYTRKVS